VEAPNLGCGTNFKPQHEKGVGKQTKNHQKKKHPRGDKNSTAVNKMKQEFIQGPLPSSDGQEKNKKEEVSGGKISTRKKVLNVGKKNQVTHQDSGGEKAWEKTVNKKKNGKEKTT